MVDHTLRRVLVVDDEENIRLMLTTVLEQEGFDVVEAEDGAQALEACVDKPPDLLLTDVRMAGMGGLELLSKVRADYPDVVVVVMSAYGNLDSALEAIKLGAYDYIAKPFKPAEVVLLIRKAEERERLKRENLRLRSDLARYRGDAGYGGMIGRSEPMERIFRVIKKVAAYKTTVLISGESGTGKELVARALHDAGPRAGQAFVPVNCGAIPEPLLESELFGHKKGAFTGATTDKRGLFAEADGGTLFLDEIGELPLSLQVKLLRVLQEEEVRRVGDSRAFKVDARVVAATVRDLAADVKAGRFREDLYYRLNVLPIEMPPLRERMDDVPALVEHFVRANNTRLGMCINGVTPDAMRQILAYAWPGNVRELENTMERAMVLAEGELVDVASLPPKLAERGDPIQRSLLSGDLSIKRTTRLIEKELITRALEQTEGNRTNAAKLLEISHRALLYKIKEYEIT
ncbi:MAG: hypothetical protein CSA65_04610 [Proteobacteria bacterium]|nr:MAG: hypothetical protein CSB49_02930 [Pseudomonadota bacterium]PIE18591.1 MAG: hypothetical protein CSA65_04610 [Pseudomonadota bacterium]